MLPDELSRILSRASVLFVLLGRFQALANLLAEVIERGYPLRFGWAGSLPAEGRLILGEFVV